MTKEFINTQNTLYQKTLSSLRKVAQEYDTMAARVTELENDMSTLVEKEVVRILAEAKALQQKKAHRLEKKGKRRNGKRKR